MDPVSKRIDEEIEAYSGQVAGGVPEDYASYLRMVGIITGLKLAKQIIEREKKRFEEE